MQLAFIDVAILYFANNELVILFLDARFGLVILN